MEVMHTMTINKVSIILSSGSEASEEGGQGGGGGRERQRRTTTRRGRRCKQLTIVTKHIVAILWAVVTAGGS